jgi:hypothetical protein
MTSERIKKEIKKIETERDEYKKSTIIKISEYNKRISDIRSKCKHKFVWVGSCSGHNCGWDNYICSICKLEKTVED